MAIQKQYMELMEYEIGLLKLTEQINQIIFNISLLDKIIKQEKNNEKYIKRKEEYQHEIELISSDVALLQKTIEMIQKEIMKYEDESQE